MTFNGSSIIFLDDSDFKGNTLVYHGQPVMGTWIVFVQGSFCGYCTQAKPAFISLAKKYSDKNVIFATVQIDGSESEKKLGKKLNDIIRPDAMQGVPAYLKFKDGKYVAMHNGGRDEQSLVKFI